MACDDMTWGEVVDVSFERMKYDWDHTAALAAAIIAANGGKIEGELNPMRAMEIEWMKSEATKRREAGGFFAAIGEALGDKEARKWRQTPE